MTTARPWAVLAIRFSDDVVPSAVLLKDLPGLETGVSPTQTALDLFQAFFTTRGNNTFNAVRYFTEMSHGLIDVTGTRVFVVTLPMTKAQGTHQPNETGNAYEIRLTKAAQQAALAQGIALGNYYGIVLTSHNLLDMAQGGGIPGGALVAGLVGWAGMDYRWIRNNGIQAWGQEMGHGFGLDHSRIDGSTVDYLDPWDVMSTRNATSAIDPDYGMRGPGVNAWNMRGRGWLDEGRVWKPTTATFDQTITLRPLHRHDLAGSLAAELPPHDGAGGHGRYLVEYRVREGWDAAIPRSAIMVHRFEGAIGQFLGTHSYLMSNADAGAMWQAAQDAVDGGFGAWAMVGTARGLGEVALGRNQDGRLEAFALDATTGSAWHCWQATPGGPFGAWRMRGTAVGLGQIVVGNSADGRLEVFACDTSAGLVWHDWQTTPNGGWHGWQRLGDIAAIGHLSVGRGQDQRLELVATDNAGGLAWHCWQTSPNGGWHAWRGMPGQDHLGRIVVGSNADGRLEAFAIRTTDGSIWHSWQTAPNADFGGWYQVGTQHGFAYLAITNDQDRRLELFATERTTGAAWHAWQTAPNGGWHAWRQIGGASGLGAIAVGRDRDGRIELVALDTSARFAWRTAQTAANADFGAWSLFDDQHAGFTSIAMAANLGGRLQLVAVKSTGHPDMIAGETATYPGTSGQHARVTVVSIDDANHTATVRLTYG